MTQANHNGDPRTFNINSWLVIAVIVYLALFMIAPLNFFQAIFYFVRNEGQNVFQSHFLLFFADTKDCTAIYVLIIAVYILITFRYISFLIRRDDLMHNSANLLVQIRCRRLRPLSCPPHDRILNFFLDLFFKFNFIRNKGQNVF